MVTTVVNRVSITSCTDAPPDSLPIFLSLMSGRVTPCALVSNPPARTHMFARAFVMVNCLITTFFLEPC